MIKQITCIDCPKSCGLSVEIENGKVVNVSGHECAKGKKYAANEAENPVRIITSTVLSHGLDLKMIPVRTDKPIPKAKQFEAMERIRKINLSKPVKLNEVIEKDFIEQGVNLIATRSAK